MPPPLILCLGNPDRGDDGVGPLVGRLLRDRVPPHVAVECQAGAAADLIDRLCDADTVFLVDAAVTGAPPGTIHAFDCTAPATRLPTRPGASSHGLGVAEAIALARMLHGLPRICRLYAIEGVTFAPGAAISTPVAAAADALVTRLAAELPSR